MNLAAHIYMLVKIPLLYAFASAVLTIILLKFRKRFKKQRPAVYSKRIFASFFMAFSTLLPVSIAVFYAKGIPLEKINYGWTNVGLLSLTVLAALLSVFARKKAKNY